MSERFVANRAGSLYPGVRREIMPGGDSRGAENGGIGSKQEAESLGDKKPEVGGLSNETTTPKPNSFLERMRQAFDVPFEKNPLINPTVPWEAGKRAARKGNGAEVGKQIAEIPYSEVKAGIKIINEIRSENDVPAATREIENMRKTLFNSGRVTLGDAQDMSNEEVVAAYQLFLQKVKVAQPKDEDYTYGSGESRAVEEAAVGAEIAQAQSPDEEILTPEKIARYLTVEDMGMAESKTGPGTMATTTWVDELPDPATVSDEMAKYIRQVQDIEKSGRRDERKLELLEGIESDLLKAQREGVFLDPEDVLAEVERVLAEGINETSEVVSIIRAGMSESEIVKGEKLEGLLKADIQDKARANFEKLIELEKSGVTDGTEWEAALQHYKLIAQLAEMTDLDNPQGYVDALYIAKAAKEVLMKRQADLEGLDDTKAILKDIIRPQEGLLALLDQKFVRVFNNLTEEQREEISSKIDSEGAVYFKQIVGGWGATVEQARHKILSMLKDGDDPIRTWRIMKAAEGLETAVGLKQLLDIPPVWEDIPRHIDKIYSFIEATDLSAEELGSSINQVINLIQNVPFDKEHTREMRDKLLKGLEAFRAMHILRITLEKGDMNPEKLPGVFSEYFEGREELTFEEFISRFEKDSTGREFLLPRVDKQGRFLNANNKIVTDISQAEFEKVNLFDISFRHYSEQLQDERIRMNMIEAMTLQEIGVDEKFDEDTIKKIKKDAGFDDTLMPERWKTAKWEGVLEEMRVEFRGRIQAKLKKQLEDKEKSLIKKHGSGYDFKNDPEYKQFASLGVDDIWGRYANGGLDITKDVVGEWHRKKTLHGAFGTIGKGDIKDLAEELGAKQGSGETPDQYQERLGQEYKQYIGKSFLEVRRGMLLNKLRKELESKDLKINRAIPGHNPEPGKIDFDALAQSGFLKSVESNAHNFAWMVMWSNYDNIRIYSRDNRNKYAKGDIYEKVVFHNATNLFFARHLDHVPEFFHFDVENRGRAMHDDVNELFFQKLPGKHHYVFPQNTLMVRWAAAFMTKEQSDYVDKRTAELMKEWDFDNEKYHSDFVVWMRSVAVMDMIENGQLTLGQSPKEVGVEEDTTLSGITRNKKLRKFEMIDVYADRLKDLKFLSPELLQDFLANPSVDKFAEIMDKARGFYSTRDPREFAFMEFAAPAVWEILNKHNRRLLDKPDMQSAAMENFINGLVNEGFMEKEGGVKFKRKNLGLLHSDIAWLSPINRWLRRNGEAWRRLAWEAKWSPVHILMAMIAEFLKRLPSESVPQSGR